MSPSDTHPCCKRCKTIICAAITTSNQQTQAPIHAIFRPSNFTIILAFSLIILNAHPVSSSPSASICSQRFLPSCIAFRSICVFPFPPVVSQPSIHTPSTSPSPGLNPTIHPPPLNPSPNKETHPLKLNSHPPKLQLPRPPHPLQPPPHALGLTFNQPNHQQELRQLVRPQLMT